MPRELLNTGTLGALSAATATNVELAPAPAANLAIHVNQINIHSSAVAQFTFHDGNGVQAYPVLPAGANVNRSFQAAPGEALFVLEPGQPLEFDTSASITGGAHATYWVE